ncbi:hypothetical protein [Gordonia sp. 852002-51296_SCH5728562-b]|uniref:hypothetical protein n=1 Tax=Gordonia sp. 852002-51296_SCH5728562-b TaxID=1834101 RepID=UPI0007EBECAD|nr:hypothetical protein [Gordonia sp. 852002-51296_SCH5728562-b]OBA43975.1 hypothetical protein A5766_00035 [Gordonia sp. 852002-51296_SCH5728562-b]
MPENDTAATARLREAEAQAQREAESRRQRREGQDTSDEIDEQREVDQAMRAASGQEKRDTTDIDQDRLDEMRDMLSRPGGEAAVRKKFGDGAMNSPEARLVKQQQATVNSRVRQQIKDAQEAVDADPAKTAASAATGVDTDAISRIEQAEKTMAEQDRARSRGLDRENSLSRSR